MHAIRQGGWPRGAQIELAFAEKYSSKDGPSAAVASALLIESVLGGLDIRPDLAVTGDLNADGTVQAVGGVRAKLRGAANNKGVKIVGIPFKNRNAVLDLLILKGPEPLLELQIFSMENFDEAKALADAQTQEELTEALALFQKIAAAGPRSVRSPASQSALKQVTQLAPNHLSARVLLSAAQGRTPKHLTLMGSVNVIEQAIGRIENAIDSDFSATTKLASGEVGRVESDLHKLRPIVDPRTREMCDSWLRLVGIFDDYLAERIPASRAIKELKEAKAGIKASAKRFQTDPELQEELGN